MLPEHSCLVDSFRSRAFCGTYSNDGSMFLCACQGEWGEGGGGPLWFPDLKVTTKSFPVCKCLTVHWLVRPYGPCWEHGSRGCCCVHTFSWTLTCIHEACYKGSGRKHRSYSVSLIEVLRESFQIGKILNSTATGIISQ